jgi:hypothetical protein
MKIIKGFLILTLVVTVIFGGLYYVSQHFTPEQLPPQLSFLPTLAPQILSTVLTASQNLPNSPQVGSVLGESSSNNRLSNISTSISNTATNALKNAPTKGGASPLQTGFEKARYLYCQQVIQDYDTRYGTAAASTK